MLNNVKIGPFHPTEHRASINVNVMRTPPFNSMRHGTQRAAATVLLLFLLSLSIIPTTSAFAWLWPAWLHAGHPLVDARSRPPQPPGSIAVAAAAAASEPPQPSSGSDVCRPTYLEPRQPSNGRGAAPEQDWPELRSLLSGIQGEGRVKGLAACRF